MASDGYGQQGFWGRGTITAGIVLLAVLIAAIALIVVEVGGGSGSSHTAAPQPTSTPTGSPGGASSSTTATTGTDTSCSLPAGNQAVPDYTPAGITWRIYQTIALPYSPTYGPQYVDGDIARCYAHDPTGALIAASQISARLVAAPSTDVAKAQVVPGAGQQAFISKDSEALKNQQGGNTPGSFAQFAGFKYVTYTPATAVVEMVTQGSNGGYQAEAVTVAWANGDWKLVLQPDGSTSPNAFPVTSLAGFAGWAGV